MSQKNKNMLEFFKDKAVQMEKCAHFNADVKIYDDGVIGFSCADCGRRGWVTQKAAMKLGWIKEEGNG